MSNDVLVIASFEVIIWPNIIQNLRGIGDGLQN